VIFGKKLLNIKYSGVPRGGGVGVVQTPPPPKGGRGHQIGAKPHPNGKTVKN